MFPDPASRSAHLFEQAAGVMPGGGTRHPVMFPPYLIYAADAHGCRVTDVDGVARIDFINNYSCQIHGHAHPQIVKVIAEQAAHITSAILPTEWELKLATLLRDRVPAIDKVRFCNSGTEAVMIAVKAARAHTGRRKILKMEGGYHGQYPELETSFYVFADKWGPLEEPNKVAFSAGTPEALLENVVVAPFNRTEITRALIRRHAADLAAIIIDPFPSRMQFIRASDEFLRMLREESTRLGIVLVFDEVFCFRVGHRGAQGHFGVTPDLVTLGKIIGGGLPIGAVGGSDAVMSVFASPGPGQLPKVFHGGTFTANPLSMAAGYAAMELMTPQAYAGLHEQGERLRVGLRAAAARADVPLLVMGDGSLTGIAFTEHAFDSYRDMVLAGGPRHGERMSAFHRAMLNAGVLISPQGAFVGSTAMADADVDATVAAAEEALKAVAQLC